MTVKLSDSSYEHAKALIKDRHAVVDQRDDWSEHQPSTAEENEFIERHGLDEFGKWHLGVDETHAGDTKARYKFPFGDFKDVHRCGLLAVKSRAHQFGYGDIEKAAIRLIEIVDSKEEIQSRRARGKVVGRTEHRPAVCAPSGIALR